MTSIVLTDEQEVNFPLVYSNTRTVISYESIGTIHIVSHNECISCNSFGQVAIKQQSLNHHYQCVFYYVQVFAI